MGWRRRRRKPQSHSICRQEGWSGAIRSSGQGIMSHNPPLSLEKEGSRERQDQFEDRGLVLRLPRLGFVGSGEDGNRGGETPEAPYRGRGNLLTEELGCTQTHLLLHPAFQQHRHARLDGEGDLPAADREVLLQGLPKGRLLHPGLWGEGCRWSKRGVSAGHPAGTFLSSGHTASPKCPRDTEQWTWKHCPLKHCPTMSMEALSNCSIAIPAVSGDDGDELGEAVEATPL